MNSDSFSILAWVVYGLVSCGLVFLVWKVVQKKSPSVEVVRPVELKVLRTDARKSGLKSDILQEGSGPAAKNLDKLTVHYNAYLTTGEKVDSSYDRGYPMEFKLGTGTVIFGWDEALKGTKVGEKRKITVPPKLAYGKKGRNKVPPNSTIIFEVELIKIESGA